MVSVVCDDVAVCVDGRHVLDGVDLEVGDGEVLAVVGPTGSGKTTLLRALAGLVPLDRGDIRFDGASVVGLEPRDRDVALVFERATLQPHRDVAGNIAFPLELRHDEISEIRERVGAEARALHIDAFLAERPNRLPAGEAQVVQIARALVRQPAVLLLDEPFAHLDEPRRLAVRREVSLIQRGFGITAVLVASHPEHASAIADRLAVLERGRITQIGTTGELHDHPCSVSVAQLTGAVDIVDVRVEVDELGAWLVHPGFRLRAWQPALRSLAGRSLHLLVRPAWWRLDPSGAVALSVERAVPLGVVTTLVGSVGGEAITISVGGASPPAHAPGAVVRLRPERYVLADPATGDALDLSLDAID